MCDEKRHPKQFELVYVYSEQKELSWSISDEYGNVDFIFNPTNQNNDSLYLVFGKGNSLIRDTIFLNDIRLLRKRSLHTIVNFPFLGQPKTRLQI